MVGIGHWFVHSHFLACFESQGADCKCIDALGMYCTPESCTYLTCDMPSKTLSTHILIITIALI